MLLIQHPSNYRQSQAMGAAGELARGKEVLKEHVCRAYMCKFVWLCEPARWDIRFLSAVPRRVFPLPGLRALVPSHRPGQGAPCCVQESPCHLTARKGQLNTSPKSPCSTQMSRVGNPWACCTSSCPNTGQGSFVHAVKTCLPIPAICGD